MRLTSTRSLLTLAYVALAALACWGVILQRQLRSAWRPVAALAAAEAGVQTGAPLLALVFRPRDCEGSLATLREYSAISYGRRLQIIGIVTDDDGTSLRALAERYDISFPLVSGTKLRADHLLRQLGYDATPAALLFNGRGALMAATLTDDLEDARRFARMLPGVPAPDRAAVGTPVMP